MIVFFLLHACREILRLSAVSDILPAYKDNPLAEAGLSLCQTSAFEPKNVWSEPRPCVIPNAP